MKLYEKRQRGFTLLEATVALGILALSLMAIFDISSGAVNMHAYGKKLTVATLLARSQMTEIEQELFDEGFKNDDQEMEGDFSREGWPGFRWRAKILAPQTQGIPPEKLLAAVFNLPLDGSDPSNPLAALFGGAMPQGAEAAAAANGGITPGGAGGMGMGMMAGLAGPLMQGQFQQLADQLTKTVREVHLTVYWKDGANTESLDLVTHVVSTGPGSDRNAGGPGAGGQNPGGAAQWIDPSTGQVIPNPVQCRSGVGMCHPTTGAPLQQQQVQNSGIMNNPFMGGGLPGSPGGGGSVNPGQPQAPRMPQIPGGPRGIFR